MARATSSHSSSSDTPRDAVALLKQDHRTVENLFKEFEDAEDDERQSLAERICQLLTVHAQIEEELLYPAAKSAFEDDEEHSDLVVEAGIEHTTAKDLIAKIEALDEDDEEFGPSVTVLSEYIKHHVKEEETELFPALKKTEIDLKSLGEQLQQRKQELMEELGVTEDDDSSESASAAGARTSAKRGKSEARTQR